MSLYVSSSSFNRCLKETVARSPKESVHPGNKDRGERIDHSTQTLRTKALCLRPLGKIILEVFRPSTRHFMLYIPPDLLGKLYHLSRKKYRDPHCINIHGISCGSRESIRDQVKGFSGIESSRAQLTTQGFETFRTSNFIHRDQFRQLLRRIILAITIIQPHPKQGLLIIQR